MSFARTVVGAAAYLVVTFPLAYTWHLVAFETTYRRLGYFSRDEPIIAFGFLAVAMQGLILSWLFPLFVRGKSLACGAAKFALVMGVYHWTVHVLAEAAKHPIEPLATWFALETAYVAIQFALAALLLAIVHRDRGAIRGSVAAQT